GDEFVILVEPIADRDALEQVRRHVEAVLALPIAIDVAGTTDLTAGGAIGCALFPDDGDNPESLLRHADHAMYARKPRQTTSATATDTVVRFPQRP
ncbi:MAG: diguanylate cyclase, partial [Thauera sp.]|nr:diguanylate cyclase [Thauera sp.]